MLFRAAPLTAPSASARCGALPQRVLAQRHNRLALAADDLQIGVSGGWVRPG